MVKNLPAMQETWVQSLGQGNSLEKEMALHSSILAWRIPWTPEARRGSQGASRAAPGESGLHARGEGERVLALESREGTRASCKKEFAGGLQGVRELTGPFRIYLSLWAHTSLFPEACSH